MKKENNAEALLPCPFCGADPHGIEVQKELGDYFVICLICGVQAGYHSIKEHSIRRWNTRALAASDAKYVPMLVEVLEGLVTEMGKLCDIAGLGNHNLDKAKEALAQLPPEVRECYDRPIR